MTIEPKLVPNKPSGDAKRIPARPSGRPQPKPFNIQEPDARVQVPRSVAGGIWRSIGRILGPAGVFVGGATPLNEAEQEWVDRQRLMYAQLPKPAPWVGDVELRGYRGAEVYVKPGREWWRPYSVDIGPEPLRIPRPDLLPGVPGGVPAPGVPRVPAWRPSYDPGHMPGEDWEPDPMSREDWRKVPWLPDPRDAMRPDRGRSGGERGLPVVGTTVSVEPAGGSAVRVRLSTHARAAEVRRPEYRDTKYGRKLVGFFNAVITRTYGAWSEVQDAAEVLGNNMYGVQNGKVVSAMDLENGSMLRVFQGYLEGDYRLDTVGFAFDFGINQLEDMGYAVTARAQMGVATKLAGDLGYKSLRQINVGINMGDFEDVRSSWVRSSEDWLSSWDDRRSERVRSLWG